MSVSPGRTTLQKQDETLHGALLNDNDEETETKVNNASSLVDVDLTSFSGNCLKVLNNDSELNFDNVIGHLEDMLVDEEFHILQNGFLEKYWEEFEDNEENKHSYIPIFNEYTNKIEEFIITYLTKRIKNFKMDRFILELEQRKNNLEGEIFEVLLTLSDFKAFKEIFIDYRAMKEGRTVDLDSSLSISSVPL